MSKQFYMQNLEFETNLLLRTREKINVIVTTGCTGKHHSVGMECCCRDRRLSSLVKEAGIWFDAREFFAVKVEDFDNVTTRATRWN